MEQKMTIHQALATLKLLDKKILVASTKEFVVPNRHNNEKINGKPIQEVKTELVSNLQSYKDLVANRRTLKNAIAMSNAVTKITIGGREYTIVEAVEEKRFAETRMSHLNSFKRHLNLKSSVVTNQNENLISAADKYVTGIVGTDKTSRPSSEIEEIRQMYIKNNTYDLIDPNDFAKFIDTEEASLNEFLTNVDFKLSESNSETFITVELLGE